MKIGGHILDNLEATFACEWLKLQFLITLDLVSTHFLENFYTCKIKDPQNFQNGSVPLTPLLEKVTRCNKGGIGKKVEVSVGSSLARLPSLFFLYSNAFNLFGIYSFKFFGLIEAKNFSN